MSDVTFIIPVRIDSPIRLANLLSVVLYYHNIFKTSSFIILEADVESKLYGQFTSDRIKYHFFCDTNKIFHRTKYINMMLDCVNTSISAVWDADAICSSSQILDSVEMLRKSKAVMVYPYNGIFWSVGIAFSELFRQNLDLRFLIDYPQSVGIIPWEELI